MAAPRGPGIFREIAAGSAILIAILATGTVGYVFIEGWAVLDAFYMTFITLTTIGFAEVQPLSGGGKIFTIAISAVGIGTFAYIASRTVQTLVTHSAFRERRMQKKIDNLSGHYIITGYGRLGRRIARDLAAAHRDVVIIDRLDERVAMIESDGFLVVQGEAEEEDTLRRAGIERAAGLVLVLPQDSSNVFVALTARELRPDPDFFIVARTSLQTSTKKLVRAGADKVISPLDIGADRIAQTILRPTVDRFMEQVLGVDTLDFDLEEIHVQAGSLLDGRSLVEIEFKRRFDAIVVGILKGGDAERSDVWRFNPDPNHPLAGGDTIIVIGSPDTIQKIRWEGAVAGSLAAMR